MVAQITASISFADKFALSSAICAAFVPRSLVSSSCAMRLWLMPVRLAIHSSLVSTIFSRSKFVKILGGAYAAMDISEAFGIKFFFVISFCEVRKLVFDDFIYIGVCEF